LEHIQGELQQADILTKPISVKVHNTLVPTIEHNFAFIVMFKSETGCYASCNSLALRFMDRIGLKRNIFSSNSKKICVYGQMLAMNLI
jgi:hypothetical protein